MNWFIVYSNPLKFYIYWPKIDTAASIYMYTIWSRLARLSQNNFFFSLYFIFRCIVAVIFANVHTVQTRGNHIFSHTIHRQHTMSGID